MQIKEKYLQEAARNFKRQYNLLELTEVLCLSRLEFGYCKISSLNTRTYFCYKHLLKTTLNLNCFFTQEFLSHPRIGMIQTQIKKKKINYFSLILKYGSSKTFYLPLKHKICRHLPDTRVQLNLLNFVEICQVAIIPIKIKKK